ncbi:MAG: hypothetical protein ACPLQP_01110 [Moorellaceae bacterium]
MLQEIERAQSGPGNLGEATPGETAAEDVLLEDALLKVWDGLDAWLDRRYAWVFFAGFGYLAIQVLRALVGR